MGKLLIAISREEKDEMRQMRSEGKSTREIAEWMGYSETTVRHYAPPLSKCWTTQEYQVVIDMVKQGRSTREISAAVRRPLNSVRAMVCYLRGKLGEDVVPLIQPRLTPSQLLECFSYTKVGKETYRVTYSSLSGLRWRARVTNIDLINKTLLAELPKMEDICKLRQYLYNHGTRYCKNGKRITTRTMNLTCIKSLEQGNALFVSGQDYEAHFLPHTFGQVKVVDADGNAVCLRDPQLWKYFE